MALLGKAPERSKLCFGRVGRSPKGPKTGKGSEIQSESEICMIFIDFGVLEGPRSLSTIARSWIFNSNVAKSNISGFCWIRILKVWKHIFQ